MDPARSLAQDLEVEAALRDAFAPLRARRAGLAPLRVRAGVRWGRGRPPAALPWSAAVARLSELSVAVGMSAMVFIAAFGATTAPAGEHAVDEAKDPAIYPVPHISVPLDDASYIRWLRLDRYVPMQDSLDPSIGHAAPGPAVRRLDPPLPTAPDQPY